jgi:dihydrofolate reductase
MKVSVFCGTSVDGFIARLDDGLDFLDTPGGGPHGFTKFFNSVDVVVIGRRTFDVVRRIGHFGLYGRKQVVVLSNGKIDLSSIKEAKLKQMSGTPEQIVAELEKRGFKHAYVDGGITIQKFLAAGLVDSITVTRVPVLIGEGIPLFGPVTKDIPLTHVKTKAVGGGLVQSVYEVAPKTGAATPKKKRPAKQARKTAAKQTKRSRQ